jgi:UDP-GlcNAc3NAcA epimerase
MKKALVVIGARPQFIKHYALELAAKNKLQLITVHTGQHYDENMSQIFFDQLRMARPDYILQAGGGNHGAQTGRMMIEIEEIVLNEKPNVVIVYGDTNSTLAGALVSAKLHIPIAHIEAGLRSYNQTMPEEVNRVLTDHISKYLFVPSPISIDNLSKEGIINNVFNVGDIMKDLVISLAIKPNIIKRLDQGTDSYFYVTLHRPYNTDDQERLTYVLKHLDTLEHRIVFAIHPRTRNAMKNFGMLESDFNNITFIDPQGYFDNINYLFHSEGLITDSGGMQKEAYWLRKKCITVRTETEWIETLDNNCNHLVFDDLTQISSILSNGQCIFDDQLYGDGRTADRIIETLTIN